MDGAITVAIPQVLIRDVHILGVEGHARPRALTPPPVRFLAPVGHRELASVLGTGLDGVAYAPPGREGR